VEIVFMPSTKQRKLGPNESVNVQVELRAKKEQTVVPAKYPEALELPTDNNDKVSPKQGESKSGAPATFTYQTPSKRVRHSGFRLKHALSRAGTADAEWESAEESCVLEFQSVIISNELSAPVQSQASAKVR
jgi:hypothetical protein